MNNYDLARSRNTTPETLERLANDEDYCVRYYVAFNPNTPIEILARLANDKDWGVRSHVAENINTPTKTLERLANDNNRTVAYYARNNKNYNNPMKLETFEFFEWLENASIEDLEKFANKES
jgi:hypothetical protein